MSTIWSRRALKKSLCPLSRRSFGRIANRSHRQAGGDTESRPIAPINLQEIKPTAAAFLQMQRLADPRKHFKNQASPHSSRTTDSHLPRLSMSHFVDLDVSQKMTAICVVDKDGRRIWRGQCPSVPE